MSASILKTQEEINKIAKAGNLAAKSLEHIEQFVVEGVTTEYLDNIIHKFIESNNAYPAPLDYKGYPKATCISVNHQVCHSIPSKKELKNGDIVNIDVTVLLDGYHGDTSVMFIVGSNATIQARKLVQVTQECLYKGIEVAVPGNHLGDVGHVIEAHATKFGFSVVREYCGHGIGKQFHEPPAVLHFGQPGTGLLIEPGMVFTIEPILNAGSRYVKVMKDGWTVVTKDHSLSAQWEHTIAITETGNRILTKRHDEKVPNNDTLKALQDADQRKTHKAKDIDELF